MEDLSRSHDDEKNIREYLNEKDNSTFDNHVDEVVDSFTELEYFGKRELSADNENFSSKSEKKTYMPGIFTLFISAFLSATIALSGAYVLIDHNIITLGPRHSSPTVGETGEAIVHEYMASPHWVQVAQAVRPSTVSVRALTDGEGSQGAGFIVSDQGVVVTNAHVINGQQSISVQLDSGVIYEAKVVGSDSFFDVAVVRMVNPPSDIVPVSLGDSSVLVAGQAVATMGNPLGLSQSMTTGVISALDRPVSMGDADTSTIVNAIQTDAPTNSGNSGGALIDGQGRVIGMMSAKATSSDSANGQTATGIGFALPINLVKSVARQLLDGKKATHASLDVSSSSVWIKAGNISQLGARITRTGQKAKNAGLRVDDTVIALNKKAIVGENSLIGSVSLYQPGDVVTLTIVRGMETLDVDIQLQ